LNLVPFQGITALRSAAEIEFEIGRTAVRNIAAAVLKQIQFFRKPILFIVVGAARPAVDPWLAVFPCREAVVVVAGTESVLEWGLTFLGVLIAVNFIWTQAIELLRLLVHQIESFIQILVEIEVMFFTVLVSLINGYNTVVLYVSNRVWETSNLIIFRVLRIMKARFGIVSFQKAFRNHDRRLFLLPLLVALS